jgi:RHS repeat-associated protein
VVAVGLAPPHARRAGDQHSNRWALRACDRRAATPPTYDADGERVAKTAGGVTTVYFQGIWEQIVGGASTRYYSFNGQVVAMRDSATNAVTYLHGDHLGSVSLATNSSGAVVSKQDFDPWGKVRNGGVSTTSLNYTGQRLDGTGLLYYHARYYDPSLARFVSADSVVPGSASGDMDGVQLRPLTVDFHEPGFVGQIAGETRQPFWFQLSDEQREKAGSPWGPANPQALNRYSYVQNNPLGATDPSGHSVYMSKAEAHQYVDQLRQQAKNLRSVSATINITSGISGAAQYAALLPSIAEVAPALVGAAPYVFAAVALGFAAGAIIGKWADDIDSYANEIDKIANDPDNKSGVIITSDCTGYWCDTTIISRDTGNGSMVRLSNPVSIVLGVYQDKWRSS